jgi:hypothetical protein
METIDYAKLPSSYPEMTRADDLRRGRTRVPRSTYCDIVSPLPLPQK